MWVLGRSESEGGRCLFRTYTLSRMVERCHNMVLMSLLGDHSPSLSPPTHPRMQEKKEKKGTDASVEGAIARLGERERKYNTLANVYFAYHHIQRYV